MAKRYMMQRNTDNQCFVYECRGRKQKDNQLECVSSDYFVYEVLYKQFVEKIRALNINNLLHQEMVHIQAEYEYVLNPANIIETAKKSGYLLSKAPVLDLVEFKRLVATHHKTLVQGTYHVLDDKEKVLIRKGDKVKDYPFSPIVFPVYETRIQDVQDKYLKWKDNVLFHFSDWELADLLWIAAVHQEQKQTNYDLWIQKLFEDRTDYIHTHNIEKMIEILYLNLVLNTHKEKEFSF